ncbi:MFS general substrate transporter [Thozetella sp. PMI_491]|nr:MFS general substrate transporter [Thozetella sp. PMI_491]
MGFLFAIMDTTIVATMLYDVSNEFNNFALIPWVVVSYTLAYVGCAVFIARLADALGRRTVLLGSFFVFLVASMGCGASKTIEQLIGFRAMQGAGGAGLYSMTMIIYPEISPPKLVPLLSSILGVIVAIAGVCGPIIGGLFTTYTTWRWAFWINGPGTFVPGVILIFAWPRDLQTFTRLQFKYFDYVGMVLTMGSTVLLVFILNEAATREYAWNSATTITILVLFGLCWIALIFWQRFISHHPTLCLIRSQFPYRILSDRVMMCSICCTVCTGFVMILTIINVPLRSEIANLYDAVKSGILLLPLMGSTAVGSAVAGIASVKHNNTWWTLIASGVLMLIGSCLLSTLTDTLTPEAKQYGYQVILGLGIGLNLATSTFITSLQVVFEDHAVAQGLVAQLRIFGGSLGVASSFIVLNNMIQDRLTDILSPEQMEAFYRSPIAIYGFTPIQQLGVRSVYIDAFNVNMRVCAGLSAVAIVAGLCTYQRNPPTIQKRLAELEEFYARAAAVDITLDETPR